MPEERASRGGKGLGASSEAGCIKKAGKLEKLGNQDKMSKSKPPEKEGF